MGKKLLQQNNINFLELVDTKIDLLCYIFSTHNKAESDEGPFANVVIDVKCVNNVL